MNESKTARRNRLTGTEGITQSRKKRSSDMMKIEPFFRATFRGVFHKKN
jgi:hypothetical protein